MKKRLIYDEIAKYLDHKNALVITGLRQVGKTTLMKQIFDELDKRPKLWFDFSNPLDQKFFEDVDYRAIYARLGRQAGPTNERYYVFIDEIQNYPDITRVMKYCIDQYGVKFVVTGSSNFYLKNLFPESLSGRKFLYYLAPMRFQEYLYFREAITREEARHLDLEIKIQQNDMFKVKPFEVLYDEYVQYGGFPEVVMTDGDEIKRAILKNIFASFFEKDIILLSDYKDIRELRDVILLLVPRVGSLLEVTKLASELSLDRPKVYQYLEFLQGTFLIKLLHRFSQSVDRSVAGGRKVYFADTGLLNVIGRVSDGQLFENVVVNQLEPYGEVSFYYKRNTAEIDAIVGKELAFEIKLHGTERDYLTLRDRAAKLGIPKAFVVSKAFVPKDGFVSATLV